MFYTLMAILVAFSVLTIILAKLALRHAKSIRCLLAEDKSIEEKLQTKQRFCAIGFFGFAALDLGTAFAMTLCKQ